MPIIEQLANSGLAITDQIMERMRVVVGVDSDYKLAKAFGKSTGALSNWRRRGTIPIDECISLCVSHDVSLDWLILGRGEAPGEAVRDVAATYKAEVRSLAPSDSPGASHSAVPMYDIEAAAGAGRFFDAENIEATVYFETAQLLAEGLNPEHVVGAKVRGDSMGDTLRDGDKVLVDRSQRTPDGVFLLRMGEELRIKRVQRVAGGALMLISDNAHYQPEMIKPQDMGDVELIGRCEVRIGRVS